MIGRGGRFGVLLAGALAVGACAPASRTSVDVHARVAVSISPTPDKMPFDPRSARLVQASGQLTELVGHTVSLQVDAAMVPAFRSGFEEALVASFENVVRDLTALQKDEPAAFDRGAPLLEHIELRYDVTASRDEAALETASHTLRIRGPARRGALVAEGEVARALSVEYTQFLTARFASATPDSVAPADRRAYLQYLTGHLPGRGYPSDPRATTPAELGASKRAARILAVLRLEALDPSLSAETHRWLMQQLSWFVDLYANDTLTVRDVPARTTFRAAERAYVAWLTKALPAMDDAAQARVMGSLFVRTSTANRAALGGASYVPFAFPGVDLFAMGLRVVDAWRAAGHPTQLSPGGTKQTFELIACPRPKGRRGSRSLAPHCDEDWYRLALGSSAGRARLARALLDRDDPVFTEMTFVNVPYASRDGVDDTLALLRAVEAKPSVWTGAVRVFADERGETVHDRTVLEEAQRWWLEHPDRRGVVLYLLAQMDRYDHGDVDWRGFGNAFSAVSAGELASYLAQGPRAMSLVPVVWRALAPGYSRAAIVLPKLDAFLGDPHVRDYDSADPYRTLRGIVGRLCAEKNTKDLAAVRAYLEQRVSAHPGEPYAAIADEATSARCKPPPPSPPPHSTVRLAPARTRLRIIQQQHQGPETP